MRRIIQRYQEGGAVQPAPGPVVATGIPQGGHAKQAIADYLAGESLGGPLSYVAGQSNVPDYRALADALGPRFGSSQPDAVASEDDGVDVQAGPLGTDLYPGSTLTYDQVNELAGVVVPGGSYDPGTDTLTADQIAYIENYYTNLDGNVDTNDYADDPSVAQEDLAMGNIGVNNAPAGIVGDIVNNSMIGKGIEALTGNNIVYDGSGSGSLVTGSSSDRSMIDDLMSNSMSDVIANQVSDYADSGKVFDPNDSSTWVTSSDYTAGPVSTGVVETRPEVADLSAFGGSGPVISSGSPVGGVLSNLNLTGPVVIPTSTLDTSGGTQTADGLTFTNTYTGGYSASDHPTNRGGSTARKEAIQAGIDNAARAAAIAKFGSGADAEQRWLNAGSPMNNGGSVGPLAQRYNNGSPGGVTTAKSGIREEEIRERQRMQARMPDVKASPVSGIGERLAMGAVNNGINTGLATMAGKEGLMGTLGTMMGSGGVGATAGTGMMSALGPIGIGIGLGKMFGLFNDGGKVPYTKRKKSPLSGE